MQLTSSPTRPEYSEKIVSRSASRTFCRITCLAVCAEMRPKRIGRLGRPQFPRPTSSVGIDLAGVQQRNFLVRILHVLDHLFTPKISSAPVLLIEIRHQVFRCPEMLASGHQHGILHRIDDDLRIDALLLAQNLDGLIDGSHCFPLFESVRD